MIDAKLARVRAHRKNVERYRRLLATYLSDIERAYIERRLNEEQASLKALTQETVTVTFPLVHCSDAEAA